MTEERKRNFYRKCETAIWTLFTMFMALVVLAMYSDKKAEDAGRRPVGCAMWVIGPLIMIFALFHSWFIQPVLDYQERSGYTIQKKALEHPVMMCVTENNYEVDSDFCENMRKNHLYREIGTFNDPGGWAGDERPNTVVVVPTNVQSYPGQVKPKWVSWYYNKSTERYDYTTYYQIITDTKAIKERVEIHPNIKKTTFFDNVNLYGDVNQRFRKVIYFESDGEFCILDNFDDEGLRPFRGDIYNGLKGLIGEK